MEIIVVRRLSPPLADNKTAISTFYQHSLVKTVLICSSLPCASSSSQTTHSTQVADVTMPDVSSGVTQLWMALIIVGSQRDYKHKLLT